VLRAGHGCFLGDHGHLLISDSLLVRHRNPGEFLDRMIHLVEGAKRQKTPNEMADRLLAILTLIFLIVVAAMAPVATTYKPKSTSPI
jgi:K+-transporting ATPase ATPase B chain